MKTEFWKIFEYTINNELKVKKDKLEINGFIFDKGTIIGKGILFSGIDLFRYIGRYLEIKNNKLIGIY